jgi:hypothetical protein
LEEKRFGLGSVKELGLLTTSLIKGKETKALMSIKASLFINKN